MTKTAASGLEIAFKINIIKENAMKITQELIDNGQKIVHLNYEKSDIEKLKKMHEE